MGERELRADESMHNAGLVARRLQAGSLPWAGLPNFFAFSLVLGRGFAFFFFHEMGKQEGSRWASNG